MKMKKYLSIIFILIATLSINVNAKSIDSFEAKPNQRVMDYTNSLSGEQKTVLTNKLEALKGETKNIEGFIVMIDTTNGVNIDEYTNSLFRKWQLGNKETNNGLLLVIAKKDRKYRTEVGYGLEGDLNDGFLGTAMRESFKPNFRANKFFEGIDSYLDKIKEKNSKKIAPVDSVAQASSEEGSNTITIISLLVVFAGGVVFLFINLLVGNKREKLAIKRADELARIERERQDRIIANNRLREARQNDISKYLTGAAVGSALSNTNSQSKKNKDTTDRKSKSDSSNDSSSSWTSSSSSSDYSSRSSDSSSSYDFGGSSGGGGSSGDW